MRAQWRRSGAGVGSHAVAHHQPAGAGGEGPDPQCRADRIDHQQDENDAEASERGAGRSAA